MSPVHRLRHQLRPAARGAAGDQLDGIAPDVFLGTFMVSMNLTVLRKDLQALADLDLMPRRSCHCTCSPRRTKPSPSRLFSLVVPNFTLGGVAKSALAKGGGARTVQLSVPAALIGKDERGGAYDATTVKIQISNARLREAMATATKSKTPADAVREAAGALKRAIGEAKQAGYAVVWPYNTDGLDGVAVVKPRRSRAHGAPALEAKPGE